MSCSVTPEQELQVLKTILTLRSLGDAAASERLRGKVRRALLESEDDDAAIAEVDELIRRYTKAVKKLDGSYEKERELKRLRSEKDAMRASRFVDDQAESGDDDDDDAAEGSEVDSV